LIVSAEVDVGDAVVIGRDYTNGLITRRRLTSVAE